MLLTNQLFTALYLMFVGEDILFLYKQDTSKTFDLVHFTGDLHLLYIWCGTKLHISSD